MCDGEPFLSMGRSWVILTQVFARDMNGDSRNSSILLLAHLGLERLEVSDNVHLLFSFVRLRKQDPLSHSPILAVLSESCEDPSQFKCNHCLTFCPPAPLRVFMLWSFAAARTDPPPETAVNAFLCQLPSTATTTTTTNADNSSLFFPQRQIPILQQATQTSPALAGSRQYASSPDAGRAVHPRTGSRTAPSWLSDGRQPGHTGERTQHVRDCLPKYSTRLTIHL